jgi:hypothetical protein
MGLYNEASLIMYPSGTKASKIYSLKPIPKYGPELVVNGDFTTDSDWGYNANWSIANGKATSTGGGRILQSIPYLNANVGTRIIVTFDIVDYTSAGVEVVCYGVASEVFSGIGTYSFMGTTTNTTNLYFNNSGQGNLVGAIDNVSVKEVFVNGDLDFARSTTKTYRDVNGLIAEAPINVMPLSYEGGGCGKFNFEPQATNLFENSEPTTTGSFKTGVVFQQTNIFSWNGIYYGDNSVRRVAFFSPISVVANVDFTVSVFVKMTDGIVPVFSNNTGTNTNDFAMTFAGTPIIGAPILIGNGIYRVFITGQTSITTFNLYVEKTTNMTNKTFEVTGFNLVQSGSLTSYIPTSGTTVTRNADESVTTGLSSVINSEEGVLYAKMASSANDGTLKTIQLSDGTNNNRLTISYSNFSNNLLVQLVVGGTILVSKLRAIPSSLVFMKVAVKYGSNGFSLWIDGTETDTGGTHTIAPNTFTDLSIINFYGKLQELQVYPTSLTDPKRAELTTL